MIAFSRSHGTVAHKNEWTNERIEGEIQFRVFGQLHDLRIRTENGRTILNGHCESVYFKTIADDVTRTVKGNVVVTNNIRVA